MFEGLGPEGCNLSFKVSNVGEKPGKGGFRVMTADGSVTHARAFDHADILGKFFGRPGLTGLNCAFGVAPSMPVDGCSIHIGNLRTKK